MSIYINDLVGFGKMNEECPTIVRIYISGFTMLCPFELPRSVPCRKKKSKNNESRIQPVRGRRELISSSLLGSLHPTRPLTLLFSLGIGLPA